MRYTSRVAATPLPQSLLRLLAERKDVTIRNIVALALEIDGCPNISEAQLRLDIKLEFGNKEKD